MRNGWILILLFTVSTALGCSPRLRDPKTALGRIQRDDAAFVERVAQARGLTAGRRARIVFHHSQSAFTRELERHIGSEGDDDESDLALYGAFDLGMNQSPSSTFAAVQREQVVAFYDDDTHTVHVRLSKPATPENDQEVIWTLAHEVGHALQHEHFPVPDLDEITEIDQLLAGLALLEGDAMLTMIAFVALEEQVPLARALVRAIDHASSGQHEQLAKAAGDSAELFRAPLLIRERVLFPYFGGMGFLGSLYRTGGFELVNRVYQRPPVTTEQVLHPQRYLDGDLAVPVPAPPPPPGYRSVQSAQLGELLTRVSLSACNPVATAAEAAAGWGGDRFSLVVDDRGRYALLWSTVWDSEDDAVQFEAAARRIGTCSPGAPDSMGPAEVTRAGDRVLVTRGLPPAVAKGSAALLGVPLVRPPRSPPFGPLQVQPIRRPPEGLRTRIAEHDVIVERLGLRLALPEGFAVKDEDGTLTLTRPSALPITTVIGTSEWLVSPATIERSFREFAEGIRQSNAKSRVVQVTSPPRVTTAIGVGYARTWRFGASQQHVRLVLVPICRGTGALFFGQTYSDPATLAAHDAWLQQIQPLGTDEPPVCIELNP